MPSTPSRGHRPGWMRSGADVLRRIKLQMTQRAGNPRAAELKAINDDLVDWQALAASLGDRTPGLASIVILAFDNAALTKDSVEAVVAGTARGSYEIILVDNGSTAESAAIFQDLARAHPEVRLVTNPDNYFFSVGNNIGAKASIGEFLVFLNNDTRVHEGWLPPLVTRLREDPAAGAVGSKLLYDDGTLQCGGLAFNRRSKMPYHIYRGLGREDPAIGSPRAFQALTGACLGIRAGDFIRLTGFDPAYLNGCEDVDLCFRLTHELGKNCWYLPDSEVIHLESKTPNRGRYIMYNRRLLVARWGDKIRADDEAYYAEDGFDVVSYHRPGAERGTDTSVYIPTLRRKVTPGLQPSSGSSAVREG